MWIKSHPLGRLSFADGTECDLSADLKAEVVH